VAKQKRFTAICCSTCLLHTEQASGCKKGAGRMLKARLHQKWVPKVGYRYSVIFLGKLLVERSRDPECDAARALLAKGFTGKLTLLDGKTGKPRSIIDIEKAAVLRTEEGPRGPRFVKCHKTVVDRSHTAKTKTA
jgi:hypothetical protein